MKLIFEDNKFLRKIDTLEKNIRHELKGINNEKKMNILRENIMVNEKQKIQYENNLLLFTGIIIPMCILYISIASIYGEFMYLIIAIFLSLIIIYILVCRYYVNKKGEIIDELYALNIIYDNILQSKNSIHIMSGRINM